MGMLSETEVQSLARAHPAGSKGRRVPPAPWQACGAEACVKWGARLLAGGSPLHKGRLAQPLFFAWSGIVTPALGWRHLPAKALDYTGKLLQYNLNY